MKIEAKTSLLNRAQVIRLSRLLHMKYRPSEIAEILDISVETVYRQHLASGCPHERDETGHIWIIGSTFRDWAEDVIAKRKQGGPAPMDDDQAWCMSCGRRVRIIQPEALPINKNLECFQGQCPDCGEAISRARRRSGANGID